MITQEVIKEIYKKYKKPDKDVEQNIDYFVDLLSPFHTLNYNDGEIIVEDIEEFSPFKRFLTRSLYAIIEFDRNVAFVFRGHIIFFSKLDNGISVHFKPEDKKGLFDRIFGGRDE